MNKINILNIVISAFFTLLSAFLLLIPVLKETYVVLICFSMLIIYSCLTLIKYIILNNNKYLILTLNTLIISIVFVILTLTHEKLNLEFTLLSWILMISFIKLYKIDYYNKQNDNRSILAMINLIIFIVIGIITIINLNSLVFIKSLYLSFFFFITGVLDITEYTFNLLIDKH